MKDEGGRLKAESGPRSPSVMRRRESWLVRVAEWFILSPSAFILPSFVLWSAAHLDGYSWDYDEGIHVYIAWLVQQGHPLYTQTFSPYTPGFIAPLVVGFNLVGSPVFV